MKKPNDDCSSLGGIEPQTNLPFIPHQIKDYGVGIPVELAKLRKRWYAIASAGICEEWTDYLVFKKWAIANGYKEGRPISRIDCNEAFSPSNCKIKNTGERTSGHGESHTKLHIRWYAMTRLGVCKEWEDFLVFKKWAISNGYKDGCPISRPNYRKKFSSDNCQVGEQGKHAAKHGDSGTSLYIAWAGMRRVGMCLEWESNYLALKEWAIANNYKEGDHICRIDLQREFSPDNCQIRVHGRLKHGDSDSPVYRSWVAFKKHAASKGLEIHPEWEDFVAFKKWAIAHGYQKGHQVERHDQKEGFTLENTYLQAFSKSSAQCWLDGERMSFAEAARRLGKSREAIRRYASGQLKSAPANLVFTAP